MPEPIVPRSVTNPVGQTDRINKTIRAIHDSLDIVQAWVIDTLKAIPTKEILVNALFVNRYRYEYLVSVYELEQIIYDLHTQLDGVPTDYVMQEVIAAYQVGTAQSVDNLAHISEDYTRNITQVLMSEPYQRRSAIVGARVFEEMKGFQGQLGTELARILRGGVQDGLNPRDVAKTIKERFDISKGRAETIARTEITGALRRGRWDESQDATERLGIKTKELWISALSPTTRHWHASRHGELYSLQDVREFYAVGGNSINCKCAQSECLVDDEGKPLSTRVIGRLEKQKAEYFSVD